MNMPRQIVIAGAGPAGTNAALELRDQGFDGRIVLIGAERHFPYRRPPLSKGFLRGETPEQKLLIKPEGSYAEQHIELELGRTVVGIDPRSERLTLDDGRVLPFDRLLLATGSLPRRLDAPGAGLAGVHLLRRVDDASAIAADVVAGAPVVVVGGGWIGAEVAASLTQMGARVTLLTASGLPLERSLGREVATAIAGVHRSNGVTLVAGRLSRLVGSSRVEAVELADGRRIPAAIVVAGVGALPDTSLATSAGLDLALGGIAVDARLRTSAENVFAAGDLAAAAHPAYGRAVRVEHWDNAVQQGKHAARTMLGSDAPYARRPFFYSDQFDLGLEYRGLAVDPDDVVVSGDAASGSFSAFWLAGDRVVAAVAVNDSEASARMDALLDAAPIVDREQLRREGAQLAPAVVA